MAGAKSGVAIIGGGIMGGGIATVFAAGGWNVHVMSPSVKTRDALPARLAAGLNPLGAAADYAANLKTYASLDAIPWQNVDLVIEAATENVDLKKKIFSQ